jgi:hypothetical protein
VLPPSGTVESDTTTRKLRIDGVLRHAGLDGIRNNSIAFRVSNRDSNGTVAKMASPIRHSERARTWLQQFDAADVSTATLLLNSLVLISDEEFKTGLSQVLESVIAHSDRAVAMFAAREPDESAYFDPNNPGTPPNAVGPGGGVGSEGVIANIIRDLATKHGSGRVLDHPSITSMRATKPKRLVLVDDMIGSGRRITKFGRYMSRSRTIKSWLSYGIVRFEAAAFAATRQGRAKVESNPYFTEVAQCREAEFGRWKWSDAQTQEIRSLCSRYAERTSRPYWPYGYDSAMTMMVFQHKCPNTCPAILWAGSNDPKKPWFPLFDVRPHWSFNEWPVAATDSERIADALSSLGQHTLSELNWMKYVSPEAVPRFVLLAATAKRLRKPEILSGLAEVSFDECDRLLMECRHFGWITWDNRITDEGRKELNYARRLGILHDESTDLTDDVYVPQSFRGASG